MHYFGWALGDLRCTPALRPRVFVWTSDRQARHFKPCFSLWWYVYVCGRGCCARELASPSLILVGLRDAFEGPVFVWKSDRQARHSKPCFSLWRYVFVYEERMLRAHHPWVWSACARILKAPWGQDVGPLAALRGQDVWRLAGHNWPKSSLSPPPSVDGNLCL
jgi:hypothetical protein